MSRLSLGVALLAAAAVLGGCGGNRTGAVQRVSMSLTDQGFVPATATVDEGKPVQLVVTRKGQSPCTSELLLPDSGIRKELPVNQPVQITFTPEEEGIVQLACGDFTFEGRVIVQ